jgi:hypothetical protein
MDTKRCPGFGRSPHDALVCDFYRNKARYDGLSGLCVACHRVEVDARVIEKRRAAIDKLGGKCSSSSCAVPGGMADPRALQFDHVDGGGRARQRAGENGYRIIQAILAGSTEFQLLCANCNWIKKFELAEHVGERDYGRTVPDARDVSDREAVAERRAAALRASWEERSDEQKAATIARRSQRMAAKRADRVESEAGLPTDESWTGRGLPGCADCGTRVKPYRANDRCGACYMREYNKRQRSAPSGG